MQLIRVATYNIHKGVRGIGPRRRLEIHNLGHAVEQLDADIVCLQEVRRVHRREQAHFSQWPTLPWATFPSRLPLLQLDHVFARGLLPLKVQVPRGRIWGQMSDHLPLIADFGLPG